MATSQTAENEKVARFDFLDGCGTVHEEIG